MLHRWLDRIYGRDMKIKRKYTTAILCASVLIFFPTRQCLYSLRRIRLNALLMRSIHSKDYRQTIAALDAGADGNVYDEDLDKPLAKRILEDWQLLWHHNVHRVEERSSALDILFQTLPQPWHGIEGIQEDPDVAVLRALLNHGADADERDSMGENFLFMGVHMRPPILLLLLEHGANPNCRDVSGLTPIMSGWLLETRLLIAYGADPNATDIEGLTVLMRSVYSAPKCEYLIRKGANVNAVDTDGRSALMYAVMETQPESVQLLVANGANVAAKDNEGHTALDYTTDCIDKGAALRMRTSLQRKAMRCDQSGCLILQKRQQQIVSNGKYYKCAGRLYPIECQYSLVASYASPMMRMDAILAHNLPRELCLPQRWTRLATAWPSRITSALPAGLTMQTPSWWACRLRLR